MHACMHAQANKQTNKHTYIHTYIHAQQVQVTQAKNLIGHWLPHSHCGSQNSSQLGCPIQAPCSAALSLKPHPGASCRAADPAIQPSTSARKDHSSMDSNGADHATGAMAGHGTQCTHISITRLSHLKAPSCSTKPLADPSKPWCGAKEALLFGHKLK